MADQMPNAAAQRVDFPPRFLDFIFAEMGDSGPERFPNGVGGLRLADGEQFDFSGVSTGLSSCGGDGVVDFGETGRKIVHEINLSAKAVLVIHVTEKFKNS
jgi:hypothetical protein